MIILYNILLYTGIALLWPAALVAAFTVQKRRNTLLQRLWLSTHILKNHRNRTPSFPVSKSIWVHALSVGEVLSAVPLVRSLKERYPEKPIVITASTQTGFEIACSQFNPQEIRIFYFPLDLHIAIKKAYDRIRPEVVIITETDLWPNFIYQMNRHQVPVVMVNARLSRRTLEGYRRFSFFFIPMLRLLHKICVQSPTDLKRYLAAGLPQEQLVLTGNLKFDQPSTPLSLSRRNAIRKSLGFESCHEVLVAGSTHPGEEEILLRCYAAVKQRRPTLCLIIAPRDPQRARTICQLAASMGQVAVTFSEITTSTEKSAGAVVVLDVIGVLRNLYAICNIAFIGGSLVPLSGHNPLEPAAFAKPVLFGPDMNDFADIARTLIACGGALAVDNEAALVTSIEHLLAEPTKAKAMGQHAQETFQAKSGAVQNTVLEISKLL